MPGAGWAIVNSQKVKIRQFSQSSDVDINYVQARKNGDNIVMVHWYQTAGTIVVSTGYQQNIERFWGRLLNNRNDGAFVQISTQVPDDQVINTATKVRAFAEQVLQLLPRYWPIEK